MIKILGRQATEHMFLSYIPKQAYFPYFISKRFGYKLELEIFIDMSPKFVNITCETAI